MPRVGKRGCGTVAGDPAAAERGDRKRFAADAGLDRELKLFLLGVHMLNYIFFSLLVYLHSRLTLAM